MVDAQILLGVQSKPLYAATVSALCDCHARSRCPPLSAGPAHIHARFVWRLLFRVALQQGAWRCMRSVNEPSAADTDNAEDPEWDDIGPDNSCSSSFFFFLAAPRPCSSVAFSVPVCMSCSLQNRGTSLRCPATNRGDSRRLLLRFPADKAALSKKSASPTGGLERGDPGRTSARCAARRSVTAALKMLVGVAVALLLDSTQSHC